MTRKFLGKNKKKSRNDGRVKIPILITPKVTVNIEVMSFFSNVDLCLRKFINNLEFQLICNMNECRLEEIFIFMKYGLFQLKIKPVLEKPLK